MTIRQYGWNEYWINQWSGMTIHETERETLIPGRIVGDFGSKYRIRTDDGEQWGELSGRLRHTLETFGEYPAVGDWTSVKKADGGHLIIQGVLPRRSVISRKAAGSQPREQIVAANIDTLFLVSALNDDYNLRRMERYLIMAWNSGASPVILLTKADLCHDPESKIAEMEMTAPGVPVHAVSAHLGSGRESLLPYVGEGQTVALTGSSGCGKSTLVNWLCGADLQLTREVREDDSRGRHTTTRRELFLLPDGGVIVDTPGMRELQLWEDDGGLDLAFADIGQLSERCRYADCRHEREEGCAVLEAVSSGELEEKRLQSYRKTQRELQYQTAKEAKSKRKSGAGSVQKTASSRSRKYGWRREAED
ncbi:ribosome small subunit-dependent GTPase A [Paenibacillus rhizophilus]|uniref:Small ribosomal subunit biogenesis GTPase RsgA n=1 Tax=Paenibacillus rhizophilus TaxID=1850366 RepID=A0A3N9Q6V5_9BACL|nr:ribosome small subunit-dependent GTPase A [Paenibacillus rhizophilus]RQW13246.1 ribosome small subunit-dependent GTPase A [Paenibacillus rhizophilus]